MVGTLTVVYWNAHLFEQSLQLFFRVPKKLLDALVFQMSVAGC
jgi:hypothetical protein